MLWKVVNENCYWLRVGEPFPTDSLVFERDATETCATSPEIPWRIKLLNNSLQLDCRMSYGSQVFGLGENMRSMDKRGGLYESFCTDDPIHTPGKRSLYGAHNFMLVNEQAPFGLFIDFPGKVTYDVGFTQQDEIRIIIHGQDADLYFFHKGTLKSMTLAFRKLMGGTYAAPKWAFGYQQSRWSYRSREEVEDLVKAFEKWEIPCDAIYLDIDYMERYKDFTIDQIAFPDFSGLVKTLKNKGIRLIPIIDAGVKIEEGYRVYEEGIEKSFFCLDQAGKPFVAAVWPGKVHFPDFLNPETRRWFGLKYRELVELGIEGFWNDMNEPSIFYTEDRLKETIQLAKDSEDKNLDIDTFFKLTDAFKSLFNHPEDYRKIVHCVDGKMVSHEMVHNLYGFNMTRAAAEGLREVDPDRRFLLFSRASAVGQGRYAGIWTGDNHSWWEHILLNLQMMPWINQCGILYTGADTGGFSDDANAQLIIRWSQFSLFTPLFRNHSALHTRFQEPHAFDEESTRKIRQVLRLRYSLIPYLYGEYMKAVHNDGLYFMPLFFDYPDAQSAQTQDQLLVGNTIMAAPIYRENARGRYVYLPEPMLLWKAVDETVGDLTVMEAGHHYLQIELEETPIFIRKNRLLILGKPAKNVNQLDLHSLTVIGFLEDRARYVYYDDDGHSRDYERGIFTEVEIDIVAGEDGFEISVENRGNRELRKLEFILVDMKGRQKQCEMPVELKTSAIEKFE